MDKAEHLCPRHPDQTVVLLAEDDVMVRNVARVVLESEGYCVLTAVHGEEAMTISDKFPGAIHLLVSDVRMPVMDGLKLKAQLIASRPDIKILLMSGEAPSPIDVPFLQKPFGPEALKQKVKGLVDGPRLYPPGQQYRNERQQLDFGDVPCLATHSIQIGYATRRGGVPSTLGGLQTQRVTMKQVWTALCSLVDHVRVGFA